jgi:hypothetical protein
MDENGRYAGHLMDVWLGSARLGLPRLALTGSSVWGYTMLNDVVEGDAKGADFYVTVWKGWPAPLTGTDRPADWREKLQVIASPLAWLARLPFGGVIRCEVDSGECGYAASGLGANLVQANGVTISQDRRTLFVADPARKVRSLPFASASHCSPTLGTHTLLTPSAATSEFPQGDDPFSHPHSALDRHQTVGSACPTPSLALRGTSCDFE